MTHNEQAIQDKKNVGSLVPNISLAEDGRSHRVVSKTCLMCQQDSVAANRSRLVSAYANSSKTLGIGLDRFCCGVFER